MKKLILSLTILSVSFPGFSQLLSWTPDFPAESSTPVTITVDANYGNKALLNYNVNDVYVHIGVITNLSSSSNDWKYVKTTWATTDPAAKATSLGSNKWSFTITGALRTYFGISNASETIQKIAILFRSGDGNTVQRNADGSDMFVPIYTSALAVRFTSPFFQPLYTPVPEPITKNLGDNISIATKSNASATLSISFNGTVIQTATNATTISATPTITAAGNQKVIVTANDGTAISKDSFSFFVNSTVNIAPLPGGTQQGINYNSNTSVTLVLYAPGKGRVGVIGEFSGSNWTEQSQYQMNKTPDGNYWWITINGLTSGQEYAYQFLVDGTLKIADPYAEKILDPSNDPSISSTTYPGLKAYPTGLTTGIVSVLQTGQTPYNWQVTNFNRPDKRNLVIYELLLRDFVANHDWNTLSDSINYFKKLGINAIEVMPFNEFEGNDSWGYNPDFYFAPDKYYGPANTLKAFIDKCHQNGIAVIMDIALNHSFGSSPMVQLYWDAANNRPDTSNPWFNPVAKHAYNVGYDMNHESAATQYFVSRVVNHWLNDYKLDGFRFDLSKGFTQTQTCDNTGNNCNVAAWGNYDQSRVDIWKKYYDTLQLKSPGSYCILEHFADNSEETVLANYGMMLWGNMSYAFQQGSMGYSGSDYSSGIASVDGWSNPYKVTYMESHDEERVMYKDVTYGNSSSGYNIKDTATALKRQELTAAFLLMFPGPKMIWQFGELGYDYSITSCNPGNTVPQPYPQDNCRLQEKPIRWDYLQQANRKKLYDVYSDLIKLRSNALFVNDFTSNSSTQNLSGNFKSITMSDIVVVGNFDVTTQTGTVTFPSTGTWYDYFAGTTKTVSTASQTFSLQPGEYHVFTRIDAALPVTIINFSGKKQNNANVLSWQVGNENDLNYYELQRSSDGQNFSFVATIKADGQSSYTYSDNDANAFSNVIFYRLKSVDKDGNFKYSSIVTLRAVLNLWQAMVTPNPFSEKINLKIESAMKDQATVIVTDISGRKICQQNISINSGNNSFEITNAAGFSNGTYFISIFSTQKTQTIKLISNK